MRVARRTAIPLAALFALAGCGMLAGDQAEIPNLICAGEATTYVDWLEGTLELTEHDPIEEPADLEDPEDLLGIVRDRGVLRVSTDPEYPPQSAVTPDGDFEGFDIDVATEIAERLGVEVEFVPADWDLITAGNWVERWDISVGSMAITADRKERLSFTQPYYYTPAQLAVAERTEIESVDELPFEVREGAAADGEVEVTTLTTDTLCGEAIAAGREEFQLWISAAQTVEEGVNAGMPVRPIGDTLFAEPLAVAIDKAGPPHDALLFEIDRIIGEMHEDGTLTEFSEQWYGIDITQGADQ